MMLYVRPGGAQTTTRAEIKSLIDKAEESYMECWATLCSLKGKGTIERDSLLAFQPRLGQTLLDLSEMYRALHQERLATVSRKDGLSPDWFKRRLKLLSDYQEVLKTTISVGKCLGDSFAWTFYRNERQYLAEHYKLPRQLHSPPGVGGEGELEFIRNFGVVNGHMALYHGITTFLRLGDFSFRDLKKHSLTAVVELKTARVSDKRWEGLISVIGPVEEAEHVFGDLVDPETERRLQPSPLPQDMVTRLNKQIAAIGKSFDLTDSDRKQLVDMNHNSHELEALWKIINASSAVYRRADDGLLLAGLKSRKRKLSTKLLNDSTFDLPTVFEGLMEEIKRLTLEGSQHNQIILGHLQAPTSEYYLERNAVPLFWWPVDLDLIKAILFYDAQIFTFYNPAYLAEKLIHNGFEVESNDGQSGLKVSKRIGEGVLRLEGFDHLLGMVSRQLWSEDSVVQSVVNITDQIGQSDMSQPRLLVLDIWQDFS
jgi:hypothetical protein